MAGERYAIFRRLADSSPYWMGFENDLSAAKSRMKQLAAHYEAAEFFIHDLVEHATVASFSGADLPASSEGGRE